MSHKRLDAKIAWITGAASGIGEATADLFADEGARVAVVDIQAERGREVVERITGRGGQALFIECDVAEVDQVRESFERTGEHFGGVQIIVNCAGIVDVAPLHEYSEQQWDRLMGVNLKSIFFCSRAALEILSSPSSASVVMWPTSVMFITCVTSWPKYSSARYRASRSPVPP